ncbi:MAG TPA: arsenic resistance protein [Symbiobacteriaceae bacterium]|nr:arsenic resistance protein [Symbiobacteriaceae bacterium]
MTKVLHWPTKNLALVIPSVLIAGLLFGLVFRLPQSPVLTIPAVALMVIPIMIGIPWKEVVQWRPVQLTGTAMALNFLVIPGLAWLIGRWLLGDQPEMMAGLAIAALLPTSGMTITWTMLSAGNVPAAIRLTVISLLAGSMLLPFYLLVMIGRQVPVNLTQMLTTVAITVLLPMALGAAGYRLLLQRYTPAQFGKLIKPHLSPISTWAMLYVVFMATAGRAPLLLANPQAIARGVGALAIFYLLNFAISSVVARWLLSRADSYTLVYSTVLRNLSIALGLALASFGPQAAFLVTLAFILQVQGAAWYGKAAERFGFFGSRTAGSEAA